MPGTPRIHTALSVAATTMLYLGVALLLLLSSLVIVQVVCRNAFDVGLPWADELARFCGLAIVFMAMPRLLMDRKHIAMEIVANLLPHGSRILLGKVCWLFWLGFSAIILWSLYAFLQRAAKFSTPALGIPNLVFYAPAILGFAVCAVVCIYLLTASGHEERQPREPDA